MSDDALFVLLDVHHQLTTDSDLDLVTRPDKYRALVRRIESVLRTTQFAYLCTHTEEEA